MKYSVHPEAANDLRDAADYYRKRAGNDLSQALVAEFERSITLLLAHPLLGSSWRGSRRYLMRRFPYSIIYTVTPEEIRVLAVAHHSRRPGYWRNRK
ncbi:MAG TPA: type II toxin-antitoxin system RelE/ParE family toxin [Blastocatellia bacterium]